MIHLHFIREFIKEKKESEQEGNHARVHEKKNSTKKKRSRPRRHALVDQESVHEEKRELVQEKTITAKKK